MNEPRRLQHSRGLKAELLASAKGDRPPAGAKGRATVAAAAAVAAGTKVASAAVVAGAVARVAVWKWVAALAIGGGAVVAAGQVASRGSVNAGHPGVSTDPRVDRAAVAAPAAPRVEPATVETPNEPPPPPAPASVSPQKAEAVPMVAHTVLPPPTRGALSGSTAPSSAPSRAAAIGSARSQLSLEIAAIDEAKRALADGDAADAVRQMDAYRSVFPRGAMEEEATAVRIEALARAQRRADARAELAKFTTKYPSSPALDNLSRIVERDSP